MNLEDKLNQVRTEYLRRMTQGDSHLLHEVDCYITSHSGKMLRPRMLLAAAATLGNEVLESKRTLLLAVCVEMLHNASLLHDDVIDRATERRGQPSVNNRWSSEVAVLVGDYHLAQIMQLLNEINDQQAAKHINNTVLQMVEAELLAQEADTLDAPKYLKIIDGKTASLFATAAALGNPACEYYGLHYGRLFQLRDDIADGEDTPFTQDLIKQEEILLSQAPVTLDLM